LRLEALEDRILPSTVSWINASSGAWSTASNWSNGSVPGAGDDVLINQSAVVTVTLAASTSIHSLSLTGATLNVTGGTLAMAADSSNAGSIHVQPGAHVAFAGNYTQSAAGSLILPTAGLTTGVGTKLLANTTFESPSVATTAASGWYSWGTSYLSTQYAHTGTQSVEEYGPSSGVAASFAATPGAPYTATVYAMTPATNPLTGSEGGFLQIIFFDGNGNQISSSSPPNSVTILSSNSATGGPIPGSVGNQGWDYFSTTAVAPANAASVDFMLQTGPYTGLSGTAGGAAFFDDPQFGTTDENGGVGTNLLTNTGFESPSVTIPNGWYPWGTAYLSNQYAHAGAQSLESSGPNSGVVQAFPVTPGVSYTGTVYAMTPAGNALTGPEGAFLAVMYYDAGGNLISTYTRPNTVEILNSTSATGGPIAGSVGNQGWNYFNTTAVAPANAATAHFQLVTGAYTGLSGTAGGVVFWDDPQFGPTAANSGTVSAVNITNNGTINIGAGDTVAAGGTFTQTSSGTLDIQLGGPPASGLYGSLSSAGATALAGTLAAAPVNGYSPTGSDGFNAVTYPSVSGTFAAYQLPSGSSFSFTAAVNPTYVGLGAVPTKPATTIDAGTALGQVVTSTLGANLAFWDDKMTTPETQQMVAAAGLTTFRVPGGSFSDDFHFNSASNSFDPTANTIPQFAQFIEGVGGVGVVTLDYGSGSSQEAAAELAYLEGSPGDSTVIGTGLEWNDRTGQWQQVDWQTVGYWATLRADTPLSQDDGYNLLRISHLAAFSEIKYWEVGNEEYGSWEIDHHGTPGPGGVNTGAAHDPATYAAFAEEFATYVAAIDPTISIGIDSADPTGASDNNWTKNVLAQGQAIGFVPGFISDHNYMQAPGQENDSTLLLHTVSDPNSVLDWSTRYADYEDLLRAIVGNQAAGVQVMATEFNSVSTDPGKQTSSLVNGLFIADSIGSMLESGYAGGCVWDLRNGFWNPNGNNSSNLYGWGDDSLLGDPKLSDPPTTGPYVAYPSYFAEQLASKIVQVGGQVVAAGSNFQNLTAYAVLEANGHLELLVINKDADANLDEQFTLQGFTPDGQVEVWQYGEAQDYAQSQTTDGSAALANFTTTVTLSGSSLNYTFPAYSMTVLDLSPVSKLTPTITWANPSDIVYGTTLSSTQLDATAEVPGTFVYTPAAGTLLGAGQNQTLSVTFTPTDTTDFTTATATALINDRPATPVITWSNPGDITYGTTLSGAQLDATGDVPGTFVYTPAAGTLLGAGQNQTLSVTFTPTDTTNYTTATATALINIKRATPVVTWSNPGDITYGTTLSGTQLDATADVPGAFVYTPAAGALLGADQIQTLSVTFTPTDLIDYTTAIATTLITVRPATPVITWSNPGDITYGTTLSGAQLDATADVTGTFVYTPAAGALLGAGQNQMLSVTFTPADMTDYTTSIATALINVKPATPVTTWSNPDDIFFGTTLSATQLNASASVPGSYVFSPAAGTVLAAGSHTLSVTFTPTDTTDYIEVTAAVFIHVATAPLTITPSPGQSTRYGSTVPVLTYSTSGFVNGDSAALLNGMLGIAATSASPVGSYKFTLGSLSAGANYDLVLSAIPAFFAITAATPTFHNLSAPVIDYGTVSTTISGHLQANAGQQLVPAGELVQITFAGLSGFATLDSNDSFSAIFATGTLIPGNSPYTVAFSYAGDANFNAAGPAMSTLVVSVPPVVVTNPRSQTAGDGEPVTFSATARGFPTPSVQWLEASAGSTSFQPIQNNPSATTTTLTLVAQAVDSGTQYEASFTSADISISTKPASLTVSGSVPSVMISPQDQTVAAGKTVTFTAQGSGSPPPAVQWQVSVDGGNRFSNIGGARAARLTLTAKPGDNQYQYRAVFSNRYGTVRTAAATLTVPQGATAPPIVTTRLAGPATAVHGGQRVTFKASASNADAFQWQISSDGVSFTNIVGATFSTFSIIARASDNGFQYRSAFFNPFGESATNAVSLAVNPTITSQPVRQTVYDGQTATFIAAATGNPQATVQWQVSSDGSNFSNVPGANVASLTFTASLADTREHFRAVFTSTNGMITAHAITRAVVLTVRPVPRLPLIITQPSSQTSIIGQWVTFTAAAASSSQATVQWQVCTRASTTFQNVPGATSGTLTFVAQATDNGSQYRAVFSNGQRVTTAVAKLTLDVVPVVTVQPTDQNVATGKAVTFTAAASGSPPTTVQWQVSIDGGRTYSNIASATGLKLTFHAQTQENGNFYRAVFSNPVGQATTAVALLTV
jgi:hypothetical protein